MDLAAGSTAVVFISKKSDSLKGRQWDILTHVRHAVILRTITTTRQHRRILLAWRSVHVWHLCRVGLLDWTTELCVRRHIVWLNPSSLLRMSIRRCVGDIVGSSIEVIRISTSPRLLSAIGFVPSGYRTSTGYTIALIIIWWTVSFAKRKSAGHVHTWCGRIRICSSKNPLTGLVVSLLSLFPRHPRHQTSATYNRCTASRRNLLLLSVCLVLGITSGLRVWHRKAKTSRTEIPSLSTSHDFLRHHHGRRRTGSRSTLRNAGQ